MRNGSSATVRDRERWRYRGLVAIAEITSFIGREHFTAFGLADSQS